jgi:hypothetical protein
MKLSEMIAKKSGIPDGFRGQKAKWDEISEAFQIEKAAILQKPAVNEAGETIVFSKGSKAGQTVMDRIAVLQIITADKEYIIKTNSKRITTLFIDQIDGKEADDVNVFGDQIFIVEPPEGWLKFVPFKQKYADGTVGNVADLIEAE